MKPRFSVYLVLIGRHRIHLVKVVHGPLPVPLGADEVWVHGNILPQGNVGEAGDIALCRRETYMRLKVSKGETVVLT